MPERKRGSFPKPVDPKALPCQVAFKTLSDEILAHKHNNYLSFVHFNIQTDPEKLLQRFEASSLCDMLLRPGESFSLKVPDDRYPDLGLVAGEISPTGVSLAHWGWRERKWRICSKIPNTPPYRVAEYPGEFDWMREIEINIWFLGDRSIAAQKLSVYDASRSAGTMPHITRSVYAPEYAETGYEGHHFKSRCLKDEPEAVFFIDLAHELFEKRE